MHQSNTLETSLDSHWSGIIDIKTCFFKSLSLLADSSIYCRADSFRRVASYENFRT